MRGSQEDPVALLGKEFSWRALGYWRGGTTTTGRREGASERRTAILQKPALQVLVEQINAGAVQGVRERLRGWQA